MSRKELLRAGLVKAALAGRITNRQGAKSLQLSVRQFQRLKRRFETGGAPALRHQRRGQPSSRRLPAALRAKVTKLMTTVYAGFNDVHLTEKLREVEHLLLSRESVRRLRLAAGRPAQRPRRAPRYRRRRTPAAAAGALVQTDGSPFACHRQVALENFALRHQLAVYEKTVTRPKLCSSDRLFWVALSRVWAGWRQALVIVSPNTVLRWQRRRFREHWTKLSTVAQGEPPRVAHIEPVC